MLRQWPTVLVGVGLVAALLAAFAALLPSAAAVPSHTPSEAAREREVIARLIARGLPVFCAGGSAREVALTFDDGPGAYSEQLVSELLGRAPATFFSIGENASASPVDVRDEATVGVVGEHTETHAILTRLSRVAARAEIADGKQSVEKAARRSVSLFRPPGDDWDVADQSLVRSERLLLVDYTVDPRDWALTTAAQVVKTVLADPRLVPGAIVLLHETHLSTVDAVPVIVAALQRRGLILVTVPRLLADSPPTVAEQLQDERAHSCVHLYRSDAGVTNPEGDEGSR